MEWLEGLKELELFEAIEAALAIAVSRYPHELRCRRDAFAEQLFAPRPLESPQSDLLEPCNNNGLMLPVAGEAVSVQNKQKKLTHREQQERRSRREEEQEVEVEVEVEEEEVEEHVEEGQGEEQEEQEGQEQEAGDRSEGMMDEGYDEAEALTDQMEEENRQIQEINRMKTKITDLVLDDDDDEEELLLALLCTLQKMQISVEALKETEIGKEVNGLRKHSSKRISSLSKLLVRGWKEMVDDWVKSAGDVAAAAAAAAAAALAGSSSGSTQNEHEESGLPSPPLEPGALLAAVHHPPSAELFQLFDEDWDDELLAGPGNPSPPPPTFDDDGFRAHILQPHFSELELQGNRESRAATYSRDPPAADMKNSEKNRGKKREESSRATSQDPPPVANMKNRVLASGDFQQPCKRGFFEHAAAEGANASSRMAKVSRVSSGSYQRSQCPPVLEKVSPLRGTGGNGVVVRRKVIGGSQSLLQLIANKPKAHQRTITQAAAAVEDTSVAARLEVAKRRLHERYREVENAKRSRVVQVMDLTELPKGGGGPKRARVSQAHKPSWTQNSKQQHPIRR